MAALAEQQRRKEISQACDVLVRRLTRERIEEHHETAQQHQVQAGQALRQGFEHHEALLFARDLADSKKAIVQLERQHRDYTTTQAMSKSV